VLYISFSWVAFSAAAARHKSRLAMATAYALFKAKTMRPGVPDNLNKNVAN
jgi:hypothetical protein